MLKRLCVLMSVMATLLSTGVAHATPEATAAGGGYPGCEERSGPSQDLSKRVTFGTLPTRIRVEMVVVLSECDTHDLVVSLGGGGLTAGTCVLVSKAAGKIPFPIAKSAYIGELACGAVGLSLSGALWKINAANKRGCGVSISAYLEGRFVNNGWRVAVDVLNAAGRKCPDKLKDEDDGKPDTRVDYGDLTTDAFASQTTPELLEGEWKVTGGKVAYTGFKVDANGRVTATGTASSGCAVVDNKQVMGVFESDGVLTLAGCSGDGFPYARQWSLPTQYGNDLRISTGATLTRV